MVVPRLVAEARTPRISISTYPIFHPFYALSVVVEDYVRPVVSEPLSEPRVGSAVKADSGVHPLTERFRDVSIDVESDQVREEAPVASEKDSFPCLGGLLEGHGQLPGVSSITQSDACGDGIGAHGLR